MEGSAKPAFHLRFVAETGLVRTRKDTASIRYNSFRHTVFADDLFYEDVRKLRWGAGLVVRYIPRDLRVAVYEHKDNVNVGEADQY
jgi:hypothetical protein